MRSSLTDICSQVWRVFRFPRHAGRDRDGEVRESCCLLLTDPISISSAADVLESAWLWSALRGALLSVAPAPDNLALTTLAGAPSEPSTRLTQTSMQMPLSKAGVPKKELRTTSKNNCLEDFIQGKRIIKERNQTTKDLRTSNVFLEDGLLGKEEAAKYFS